MWDNNDPYVSCHKRKEDAVHHYSSFRDFFSSANLSTVAVIVTVPFSEISAFFRNIPPTFLFSFSCAFRHPLSCRQDARKRPSSAGMPNGWLSVMTWKNSSVCLQSHAFTFRWIMSCFCRQFGIIIIGCAPLSLHRRESMKQQRLISWLNTRKYLNIRTSSPPTEPENEQVARLWRYLWLIGIGVGYLAAIFHSSVSFFPLLLSHYPVTAQSNWGPPVAQLSGGGCPSRTISWTQ